MSRIDAPSPSGRRSSRRVTLADVAARVGTSTITVSRALRRPEMVSPALRARIAEAVHELGYIPDPAAQALASQRTSVIGVLIPSVTNNVFSDVLSGVYSAVSGTPYKVQLGNTRYRSETEEELIRVFLSQRPAGLVVAGVDQTPEARTLLERAGCPVVQIMDLAQDPIDMMVGFSHHEAAQAATEHLIAQGYRAPAFIGARMDPRSTRRRAGFRAALDAAGLPVEGHEMVTNDASSVSLGGTLLDRLLAQAPETDAVFCNNDDLALGVQFAALRRGFRIGESFGVCGFNDFEVNAAAYPTLTSLRTFRHDMGRTAMEKILARLDDRDPGPRIADLGFRLMPRESTRRG
ncbi:LacI family DNA-binding transcriptional regulator [Mesobaculum littorinae]|uniref:LacI family DNA-binding transcriptional regulator n=1 Tax=Mesobaculum littorinae TaxID=2486419 RepID=A0A438AJZ7_9RHOB|nr:LacI family DNA-binding transcriptional regulator [Mesobaculum littorinae]RVV99133.1 LacI family DNA-binding transcriptional regulator [Mesobaculum littorinae]